MSSGRPKVDPPKRIKHYEILGRLGEGGMGVVYRARDTRLGRIVALKTLPPELAEDEERARRFEREARIVSGMTHPGIATVYDFDRDGDVTFLTMELIDGSTLRELLREGFLPLDQVLDCGIQVAEALAAAHREGVVHRDLKPENVMAAGSGYYKVLDFGIARIDEGVASGGTDPSQTPTRTWATRAGSLMGTVAYMSPEQVLGESTDARSDLFSLGSVLYELASGRPAFGGANEVTRAHAVAYEEPAALRTLRPDVPRGLEQVVGKCLAKHAADRYADAGELAEDLRTLRHDSRATRGPLIAERPARARRLRWIVGGVVLAAVLGIGATIGVRLLRPDDPPRAPATPVQGLAQLATETAATSPRPRVIVAFFENNSGDPELDRITRGLPEMLTTDLSRSKSLEVIATQRLHDLLAEAGGDTPRQLDRSTTAELARWAGADLVISGSVFQAGATFRIDAQAYDTKTGTVAVAHKVEGADLLPLVNELTAGLVRGLRGGAAEETPQALTRSEQAFERFVEGRRLYAGLRLAEAERAFAEALRHDDGFTLARLYLAKCRIAAGRAEEAAPLLERIGTSAGELPEGERLLGQALAAFYRDRDFEAGRSFLSELVRAHPGHGEALVWWSRGLDLLEGSRLQATRKLREAIEADPNNLAALVELAEHLAGLGEVDDARRILDRARRRDPLAGPEIERRIEALGRER